MRKFLAGFVALFLFAGAGIIVSGAPITLLTNTSGCQEASQLLFCINNLINILNGNASGNLVSIGTFATSSGGAINGTSQNPNPGSGVLSGPIGPGTTAGAGSGQTPIVLNAQRGIATFQTAMGVGPWASSTLMIINSFITAQSVCSFAIQSNGGIGGTQTSDIPFITSYTPTAGVLNVIMADVRATAPASPTQSYGIAFNCM